MNREERYLCEVGYPRAVWRAPADPEQRRVWEKWLKGLVVAIGSCVALAFFLSKGYGPQETTAEMERMAKQLERMERITPQTAQTIQHLISEASFDCDRAACEAQLKERNHAVRAYLATLIAEKSEPLAAKTLPREIHAAGRLQCQ